MWGEAGSSHAPTYTSDPSDVWLAEEVYMIDVVKGEPDEEARAGDSPDRASTEWHASGAMKEVIDRSALGEASLDDIVEELYRPEPSEAASPSGEASRGFPCSSLPKKSSIGPDITNRGAEVYSYYK